MLMVNWITQDDDGGSLEVFIMITVEFIIQQLVSVFKIAKVFSWGVRLAF